MPELEERIINCYVIILDSGRKAGTEDWNNFLSLIHHDYRGQHGYSVIRTFSRAIAKSAVIGIRKRAVPIIGNPEYCLEHGGLFRHLPTRQDFEENMRAEFGTKVFQIYSQFRKDADDASREQILCAFTAQEASVGNAIESPGKNDAVLGDVI